MKVALYARVSTSDKDQEPETQLMALRDFVRAQGWETYREYIDHAPANDMAHRIAWRELLDAAAKRRFRVVLVFKLDRAFRSVKHMHDTLSAWEAVGVSFQSVRERFDTSTALGRLLLNLLVSLAEFELELIRERVKAGMDRARRQGHRIGRPRERSAGASNRILEQFWSASIRAKYPDAGRLKSWALAMPPSSGCWKLVTMMGRRLPEVDSEWRDQDGDSREGDSLSTEATPFGEDDCHQFQSSDIPASGALTSIHGTYTLASPHGPNANEVDKLMVKHFLDTLAEVALAIASQQVKPWTP